jgi:uncharacterized protein YebE (UPF0316 family)
MTSFVFCVLDMSVCVDAILVCHVIDNVVAADNVGVFCVRHTYGLVIYHELESKLIFGWTTSK